MMIVFFWVILALIIYTYFGYPVFLTLMALLERKQFKKSEITPTVSLIIAAYNEEKSIQQKIVNSLSLDYPKDKLEIIIASDCSSDKTEEITAKYRDQGVRLSVAQKRSGKTAGRNRVVPEARGEINLLSDATGMYEKDVIRKLVRNFADRQVGCVAGILRYINPTSSVVGSGEGLYWRYEVVLRKKESLLGNLTAVSGSIYAFRKELFRKIPEELADDLIMPLTVKKLGYFCVFEPEAVCTEEAAKEDSEEFSKRVRIANRNIMGLLYCASLLNIFKYGVFAVQLISHKVLRLLMPLMMIALFVINPLIMNRSEIFASVWAAQIFFYGAALLGFIIQKRFSKRNKVLCVPLFFCLTNLGILLGIFKFCRGQKKAIWEPVR